MLTFLGGGRGCAGALTRPSTRHLLPKKKGGHIYGKNEGWAYLRKLLYTVKPTREFLQKHSGSKNLDARSSDRSIPGDLRPLGTDCRESSVRARSQ